MLNVYRDVLPDSYLLVLAPRLSEQPGNALARALHRASRSGKAAVWVDCSLLDELTPDEAELLLAYDYHLRRQQIRLVLCHVNETLSLELTLLAGGATAPCIVPTVLDAAGWSDSLAA
jgi:hypothetical protein